MSFHFKRIQLKDWLVYGGDNKIEFSDFEQGRNLVVFNGQNGFGKTSFLRALTFVFSKPPSKSELLEYWNEHAKCTKAGSVEVGIEFTHGDRACKIIRGAYFKPWGDTVSVDPWVKLFVDGVEETEQVVDKIEQLLPCECLEFIFFDGAEISRYARKQHETGVREAIEKVLGIPAVRNLRDDLEKVVGDLEEEQERLLGQSQQAQNIVNEIDSLKEDEENYRLRYRELLEKKQSLESTKAELEKESAGIATIERERQELKDKRSRRADLLERLNELDEEYDQFIPQIPLVILESPLRQIVEELRAKQQVSPRRESHFARSRVLKDLLNQEECLCGRDIDENILQKFRRDLELIEAVPSTFSTPRTTSSAWLDLAPLLKHVESLNHALEAYVDKRAAVVTRLEELSTDIYRLEQMLEGHESATVNELFKQIGQITQQIAEEERHIPSVSENIERTRSGLQQKQRELDVIGASDAQARGVTKTLEETRKMFSAVSELVERLVEEKRADIQKTATYNFKQITNKPQEYDGLRLNRDYSLEVVRKDGSAVENHKLSAGEKEVVAYSFITALNLSSVDPAPFVMDTPFGHLDSAHRSGFLRSLPKLHVQVILLATDRDLPPNERDGIDRYIAKEFTLLRDQRNALTTIEEN